MPRIVRSARGDIVDFDLIAITNQLASAPVPVSINERRQFIDDKDGIKPNKKVGTAIPSGPVHEALKLATEAAATQRSKIVEPKEALKALEPTDDELKRKTS